MSPSAQKTKTLSDHWNEWLYRWVLLSAIGLIGGYVVFWSDSHNDTRYVAVTLYKMDRENDERFRSERVMDMNRRFDVIETQLKSIAVDIKEIGRKQ
jgi:hypothetical protein